jgi:hypothetical protein
LFISRAIRKISVQIQIHICDFKFKEAMEIVESIRRITQPNVKNPINYFLTFYLFVGAAYAAIPVISEGSGWEGFSIFAGNQTRGDGISL